MGKAASLLAEIEALLSEADADGLTGHARRQLIGHVDRMRERLEELTRKVDPNELPDAFFDPAEPSLIGNFVALALMAQDRKPLGTLKRFYGAGVYAIYYRGDAELYAPIAGTETPIYVGKADPQGNAKTPIDQGTRLSSRLDEHRRNIEKVAGIEIGDFDFRALAVQSGYQAAAENHLIRMFWPIWNNETNILFGIGKHGDSSETRANNKSPFDIVHPGRKWAERNPESQTAEEIGAKVRRHFETARIFQDGNAVLQAFADSIRREDRIKPSDAVPDADE